MCGDPRARGAPLKIGGIRGMKSSKSAGEDTKPGCRDDQTDAPARSPFSLLAAHRAPPQATACR
jgi:hypothetical protein